MKSKLKNNVEIVCFIVIYSPPKLVFYLRFTGPPIEDRKGSKNEV